MRPFSETVAAVSGTNTYSSVFVPDIHISPFSIGIGVDVVSSCVYSLQHTFSDPFSINLNASAAAGTWFTHEFLASSKTSDDGNYAFPVRGIRAVVSGNSSGSILVTIVQAGR